METNSTRQVILAIVLTTVIAGTFAWAYVDISLRDNERELDGLRSLLEVRHGAPKDTSTPENANWFFLPIKLTGNPIASSIFPAGLSWHDEKDDVDYVIKSATVGKYEILTGSVPKSSLRDRYYDQNEVIEAIVFNLTMTVNMPGCPTLGHRLIVGTGSSQVKVAPLNRQFIFPESGGCYARGGAPYTDVEIAFPLADSERQMQFDPMEVDSLYKTVFDIQILESADRVVITKKQDSDLE